MKSKKLLKIKILIILIFTFLSFKNTAVSSSFSEEQTVNITKNLRCLICQGQSVYDSQSEFAISMKILIEKKLKEGNNEREIYSFLKSKYGDWIVYEPDLNFKTIFLWLIPLILFIFGGFLIFRKRSIN